MNWSVIGHQRIKKYFARALKEGFSSHAYLLSGPSGIGKRTLVTDVIRAAHPETIPGVNDPYTALLSPNEKGTISIQDHVRPMTRTLSLQPPPGVHFFVLMDDAECLSRDAVQSILKILEEPPSYVIFLLVSSAPGLLPETIRSRCHEIRCVPPRDADIRTFLEERKVSQKYLDTLMTMAGGSIGWLSEVIGSKRLAQTVARVQELEEHLLLGRAERLIWAGKLAKSNDIRAQVLQWLTYTRSEIPERPELTGAVRGLLELHETLGSSGANTRLALEYFALNASPGTK